MAVESSLLANTFLPSSSVFADTGYFYPIVDSLSSDGAPLFTNIYPYFALFCDRKHTQLDYALFTASRTVVTDSGNGLRYHDLFDGLVNSFHAALSKVGSSGIGILIPKSGWPSQGTDIATSDNVGTYYKNLIKHVGNGAPMKVVALETYLFAIFYEDKKEGDKVQRYFGVFTAGSKASMG